MKLLKITQSDKNASIDVNEKLFGVTPNEDLIAHALYVFQSNQRQGTSKVKTRSEINRTKKKWFKQKGTGNARHGARTPSLFVGGGVAHGPNGLQNWSKDISKSQKKQSMIHALSAQKKNIAVLEGISDLSGKTKEAYLLLKEVSEKPVRMLVVIHDSLKPAIQALSNMANVVVTRADRMNIYETMVAEKIVMTEEAIKVLEERLLSKVAPKAKKIEVKPAKEEKKETAKPVEKKVVKKVAVKAEPKKVAAKKPAAKTVKTKKAAK